MAVLVAAAGAGLSTALGLGPQAGWIIGSAVGSLLFPGEGQNTTREGPRLGDLTVTSSAYGQAIPIVYGSYRLAGNMVWSTGIEEVKNVQRQTSGGKGGPTATATTITYTYFASFALTFCEGPVSALLRMWADGKLIYDATGDQDFIQKNNIQFRFYNGTETQGRDPLIADDKGAADTPAYRGLCYIVFERLPLQDYGNRVPNITVEITTSVSDSRVAIEAEYLVGSAVGTVDVNEARFDKNRRKFYTLVSETFIRRFDVSAMREDRQSTITVDHLGQSAQPSNIHTVTDQGYIIVQNGGADNSRRQYSINPDTLQIVSRFGENGAGLNPSPTNTPFCFPFLSAKTFLSGDVSNRYFLLTVSQNSYFSIFDVSDGSFSYVWDSLTAAVQFYTSPDSNAQVHGTCGATPADNFCEFYTFGSFSNVYYLHKITVSSNAFYDNSSGTFSGVRVDLIRTYAPLELTPQGSTYTFIRGVIYDQIDNNLIIHFSVLAANASVIKLDSQTGDIKWRTDVGSALTHVDGINDSEITESLYGWIEEDAAYLIRTTDGELVLDNLTGWSVVTSTDDTFQVFDGRSRSILGASDTAGDLGFAKWRLSRELAAGASLDGVVSDLTRRCGLMPAEIDVTELNSQIINGYALTRRTSVRAALELLASAYFFDAIETDFVLKFIFRDGKSAVADISQNLLIPINQNGEFITENRIQEIELPLRFSLAYIDPGSDYQAAVHNSKRILNPTPTMQSNNELNLEIPIVLGAEIAKQITEKLLFLSWVERSTYAIKLSQEFLNLNPADIINISLNSGYNFRARISEMAVGTDFSIEINAISEDAAQYTSTVRAGQGNSGLDNEFTGTDYTKLILLCSPLLRDSDDTGRTVSVLYFFLSGIGGSGWSSGTLYASAEGTRYETIGSVVNPAVYGSAATLLPDTDAPFSTDNDTALRVYLDSGDLSSVSQLEMANGANAAALIPADGRDPEIIQFRDVFLDSDGSYVLSGLLRGRRGTDYATSFHSIGDTFLLLNINSGDRTFLQISDQNVNKYYKAVTSGQVFEEADAIVKSSPLNDLKPYAPVFIKSTGLFGADVTITWARRTRIAGGFKDGSGEVPLNEDAELYDLEIYNGLLIVRTVQDLTAPQYVYLASEQAADFSAISGYVDRSTDLLENPDFEVLAPGDDGTLRFFSTVQGWVENSAGGDGVIQRVKSSEEPFYNANTGEYAVIMNGLASTFAELSADCDISAFAEDIDTLNINFKFSAAVGHDNAPGDLAQINVVWYDDNDVELVTDTGTGVTLGAAQNIRLGANPYLIIEEILSPPVGARSLTLILRGQNQGGTFIEIVWDTVKIETLQNAVTTIAVRVYQKSAQVGRGHPSRLTPLEI